jgi:hypothetical protein
MIMSPRPNDAKPLSSQTQNAVAQLESLIDAVTSDTRDPESLLCEHLNSARFYLLGGMWDEYRLSLDLLSSATPLLTDEALRARVTGFVKSQKDLEPAFKN